MLELWTQGQRNLLRMQSGTLLWIVLSAQGLGPASSGLWYIARREQLPEARPELPHIHSLPLDDAPAAAKQQYSERYGIRRKMTIQTAET
uniref:Putative secreted protein n=1 Tax=Anopheles triannulatus TaxID=58253 RepID=A0A2M4B5V3_9DIPT